MATSFTTNLSSTPATPSSMQNSSISTTSSPVMSDSLLDFAIPRRRKSLSPATGTSLLATPDGAHSRSAEDQGERRCNQETNANYKTLNANNGGGSGHNSHIRDTCNSNNNDSEDQALYRKRPRSSRDDPKGLTRINNTSASGGSEWKHGHQRREEKVGDSSGTPSSAGDERRSSLDSVNSNGSSPSGGFRRLKKFSPGSKKKQLTFAPFGSVSPSLKSISPSSPTTSSDKKLVKNLEVSEVTRSSEKVTPMGQDEIDEMEEQLAASDSFQKTQLRLWKMAQEQHRVRQEAQEQKRLRKMKRKQEREKQMARSSVGSDDCDGVTKIKTTRPEEEPTSSKGNKSEALVEEREALVAKKKLKKKKKLQRLATEAERLGSCDNAVSSTASGDTSSSESTKTKKKRRLVKMSSFLSTASDDDDGRPSKKKIKAGKTGFTSNDIVRREEKTVSSKKASLIPAGMKESTTPIYPTLTMALADTVKTRVRSCNKKDKDELELLQAASFETKKKRKKNKLLQAKFSSSESGSSGIKKKKKKRLSDEPGEVTVVKRKPGRPPKHKKADLVTDTVYDADVEAEVVVKRKRGRPRKNKKKVVAAADAPSETSSSSATVLAGAAKEKKKKVNSQVNTRKSGENSNSIGRRQSDHPLPFKKRMASAAAAETSMSWEKHGTSSTTASKISLSSAGTGPGASPEFGTEASSLSEVTHPLGSALIPSVSSVFPKSSASVPREILSNSAIAPSQLPSFDIGANINTSSVTVGPGISSDDSDGDDSSDSSSDSETDDEELFNFANRMFGTSAKPLPKDAKKSSTVETSDLSPEMCEMERRRQKQEETRTLTTREINAILKEETDNGGGVSASWVRRSVRQPSRSLLSAPLTRTLLDKLRGNDTEMVVLKMKKYISDPDAPAMVIDAALDALEECTNCESLYIQVCFDGLNCPGNTRFVCRCLTLSRFLFIFKNFNQGMRDKQVLHLLKILQMPTCNIWCLNIGETYNVAEATWEAFAEGLKKTKITHMYASEHTITSELKDEIRETIRLNRKKHNMHNDPNNLDVIVKCTHCWWNPINAKVLRPHLQRNAQKYAHILNDKKAQGLRGTDSGSTLA